MSVADRVRHSEGAVRLRAKWVLPIESPPIENGEVVIEDGRITQVGKQLTPTNASHIDFGLSALMPGFVNVHAHLEYTVMRGLLEDVAFFTWIRTLTTLKTRLSFDDWVASATFGAAEMLAGGITTVADACDAGASLSALLVSGQRGIVFREVFGIDREPPIENILAALKRKIADMEEQIERHHAEERLSVGVSPHAPYTVSAPLFGELAAYANSKGYRQCVHVGESPAEVALIERGTGAFAEMYAARGIDWTTPGVSPVRYVSDTGAFDAPTLAVHVVHADKTDAELLASKNVAVAHCPKSNGKLGAGFAPVKALLKAGVTVGLGTDSVASNNSADMFEEMRSAVFTARAREQNPDALTARDALYMATLGGAKALGLDAQIGSLRHGKRADLCVVRLDGLHLTPTADDNPVAALVYAARASDVALTFVDGRVLYETGTYTMLDIARLRPAVAQIRARLFREWQKEAKRGA
ncbi:MAG: amidohydrolase family protein [Armatimonadetes bacterium]|nr:amidohydrolase family protein [Armatimonadota bacterium]